MSYVIYHRGKNHPEQMVSCTDDLCEVGVIIEEDRRNLDWEPEYRVVNDSLKKGTDDDAG